MTFNTYVATTLIAALLAGPASSQLLPALPAPGPACLSPIADVDPRRSLFITEVEVVEQAFSLEEVLDQLARDSGVPGLTAQDLWVQWWDTQNENLPSIGGGGSEIHCDDQTDSLGNPAINGYPIQCPRNEGSETSADPFNPRSQSFYKPIALINRFDLAPTDGANCGEYRVIFGRQSGVSNGGNRNLVIFEAVLPNPQPGCGIDGCKQVARFWERLSHVDAPAMRAQMLREFYLKGDRANQIQPVIRVDHFGPGNGQIRTNQFMSGPNSQIWQLREFKLALQCAGGYGDCDLQFVPVSVKTNPFGELFSEASTQPNTFPFMRHMLTQVENLSEPDLNGFFNVIPNVFNAGQSNSQPPENDYPAHFANSPRFERALGRRLRRLGIRLDPIDLVERSMTQSCGGCHQLSNGADLGGDLDPWPSSLGFVHVDEGPPVAVNGIPHFEISPALEDVFIPHREEVFERYLSQMACVDCEDPGLSTSDQPVPIPVPLSADGTSPAWLSPDEVGRIDAERKQGLLVETLGGPRRVH